MQKPSIPPLGRTPAALLLAALTLGAPVAFAADPVPQTVLDTTRTSCLQSCSTAGKPAAKCNAYCTCMADSIEEGFTGQEYAAANASMVPGKPLTEQPIPEPSKSKLVGIVTSCGKQSGIQ